jgi:hypothetical protein
MFIRTKIQGCDLHHTAPGRLRPGITPRARARQRVQALTPGPLRWGLTRPDSMRRGTAG